MKSSTGISRSCQDCGNKAKRECEHKRCRSCCKSRGLQCPTHVKSTWVPVVKRRQRQQQFQNQHLLLPTTTTTVDYHHHNHLPLSLSRTSLQLHPGLERGNFPAEINSLATFHCIRVSSEENEADQYAYQTSINVGGHVFKGILYGQGSTAGGEGGSTGGDSSSATTSDPQPPHLHQFNITTTATATTAAGPPPPSGGANLFYPPPQYSLYSAPYNAFLPGMQFFPPQRP